MSVLCLYKEEDLIMIVSGGEKDLLGWFEKGMDKILQFSSKSGKLIAEEVSSPKKP